MDQMHWNSVGGNKWITKRSVCKHPTDVVKELSDSCILISAMRVEQGRHEPGHSPPSARVLHHCRLCFSTLLHCEHPCAWMHRYILNNSDPPTPKRLRNPTKCKAFSRHWVTIPKLFRWHFGPLGETIGVGEENPPRSFTSLLLCHISSQTGTFPMSCVRHQEEGNYLISLATLPFNSALKFHPPWSAASVNIPHPRMHQNATLKYSEIRLPKDATGVPCSWLEAPPHPS